MKAVNKKAQAVLDVLTEKAQVIDNQKGFMSVHVEELFTVDAGTIWSIAHYYEQNGDMMRDPDVEFLKAKDGKYYPLSFRQDPYFYQEAVEGDPLQGEIKGYRPRMQKDIAVFCGTWMQNIKQQQDL